MPCAAQERIQTCRHKVDQDICRNGQTGEYIFSQEAMTFFWAEYNRRAKDIKALREYQEALEKDIAEFKRNEKFLKKQNIALKKENDKMSTAVVVYSIGAGVLCFFLGYKLHDVLD